MKPKRKVAPPKTGWPHGMLQDDCRELSIWLSTRMDARYIVRCMAKNLPPRPIFQGQRS